MMMNETSHLNCPNDMDGDDSECKDIDASHEDDWDDDFKKDLECEIESHTTSTPKLRSNLEEVIELVIQDAIDYANSPEAKRILPHLTRKPAKGRSKSVLSTNANVNHTLPNVQNLQHQQQQQSSVANNSGLMSANINGQSPFHPLLQQNLNHNMQHMLQLAAASGKGGLQLSGASTTTPAHQHSNSVSQSHQQITNAMMGFSAAQLPNIIMPSYNASLPSNYNQQNPNNQYSLSVPLSHIQLAQQQSQLILGNNQNSFADLSTSSNSNNNSNNNFGVGISSANPQIMQSYAAANFGSNASISVSPYHIPGMMQTYASQGAADLSISNTISQNESHISISNPTSSSCFLTSSKTNNNNNASAAAAAAALNSSVSSSSLLSSLSNQNVSSSSSLAAAAAAAAAASVAYPSNAFDLQQSQLYAQQRLLQAQQQQQQQQQHQQATSASLFPDYAAVMARYGAYH